MNIKQLKRLYRLFFGVEKVVVLDECLSDQYNYVIKRRNKIVTLQAFTLA